MTTIHHGLDLNGPGGLGTTADRTQASPAQTTSTQTPAQPVVAVQPEVEITPTAHLLARLEQQISGTPDLDQSRVDAIRQALANGTYRIDAGRIADGVLAAQKFDAQAIAGSGAQASGAKAFADTAQRK